MKLVNILFALASLARAEWPTRGVFFEGTATTNGVHYRFATVVEPVGSNPDWGNGIGSGIHYRDGKEHRILWDERSHVFFGYDLAAERADNSGSCRATISALTLTTDDVMRATPGAQKAAYRPLLLPAYPAPHIVNPGDIIALDLLVSPDGKQKVVDYVQIDCREPPAAKEARDFTARDVELRLVNPKLTVNDREVEAAGLHGEIVGNVLWLQVPGKGRFLLTVAPYPSLGFRRAGKVGGSEIDFQHGGDRYRIRSAEPMFRSEQQWNLYVRLDEFQQGATTMFGAQERLRNP